MPKPFPPGVLRKVADDYAAGLSYAELKAKYNAGDGTVRHACKEFKVKMRGRGSQVSLRRRATHVKTVTEVNAALAQSRVSDALPVVAGDDLIQVMLDSLRRSFEERRIEHVAVQLTSPATTEVRFLIARKKP